MTRPAPRQLTAAAAVLAATALLAACSGGDAGSGDGGSGDSIVVSTFPFGVEQFQEAVVDPFTEATGIEVEIETGSNADRLSQLELAGDRSGVDVMLISDAFAASGQEKELFESFGEAEVPNLGEIADFAVEEGFDGPAYSYQLNGILYNTDEVTAEQAADWELFADPALAGRLAFPDFSVTAGQLAVSGVADSYGDGPYDIDTAYEVIGSWAPGILQFYSSSTEVTNLLTQGEIVAADSLNGFATTLVASGEPVAWTAPAEGRYMATNRAMVPVGAPNSEGAHAFIDYLLSVEAQTASADLVGDLPVNLAAEVPAELTDVVGDIAADPIAAGYATLDPAETTPNRAAWLDRFAREVSSR
ncbi:extracellular solute-binding protein [Litorihabitans aurantiacus]|uniref:Spermidine/putrescine-binding periplasmic protein 1 n=1 Tax=Litorihabitans aurantiacus TaxID=1930061 RepID=A0AA38CTQ1_9MICO|nr:extracellular solute-binding protein [Litorihabitans aurantiacus]GMA32052.1 spermidine/putrescine-binding periplasmic protein 1 [Litorihabitans aurantiacus]